MGGAARPVLAAVGCSWGVCLGPCGGLGEVSLPSPLRRPPGYPFSLFLCFSRCFVGLVVCVVFGFYSGGVSFGFCFWCFLGLLEGSSCLACWAEGRSLGGLCERLLAAPLVYFVQFSFCLIYIYIYIFLPFKKKKTLQKASTPSKRALDESIN